MASGRQVAQTLLGATRANGRALSLGLFDSGTRNPEVLLATSPRRVAWRRPLAAIFTRPNVSSDGGWNLDRLPRSGRFVGSVATAPKIVGTNAIIDLKNMMTAAFSIGDGKVYWRHAGFYACSILPCHGGVEAGYGSPATVTAGGPSVGLREVMTGTASIPTGGGTPHLSPSASLTIQGFDLQTGKTLWAFDAGRLAKLITGELVPARIDLDTIVLPDRKGQLIGLNLMSGSSRPISAARAGWCRAAINYKLSNTVYYGGKSGEYVGQQALYPCSGSARRLSIPAKVPAVVARIGASTSGIVAWTDSAAVHGAASG